MTIDIPGGGLDQSAIEQTALNIAGSACDDIKSVLNDIQGGYGDVTACTVGWNEPLVFDGTTSITSGTYPGYGACFNITHSGYVKDGQGRIIGADGTRWAVGVVPAANDPHLGWAAPGSTAPVYQTNYYQAPTNEGQANILGDGSGAGVLTRYGYADKDVDITTASGAMVIDNLMGQISTRAQVASQLVSAANKINQTTSRILSQG